MCQLHFPALKNEIKRSIIGVMKRFNVYCAHRFFWCLKCFFSQNQPSVKSRVPQHEHLVATRAKPNPELLSQRWMCSFLKPCAKRMNAVQKRSEHFSFYGSHGHHINTFCALSVFGLIFPVYWLYFKVKNVYQTSFSAFLDSLDLSRSPDFPQVWNLIVTTPALLLGFTVCRAYSETLLFPLVILFLPGVAIVESDSWRLFSLLSLHVCFNIHGVRKMCTQAGDPL